MGEQNVLLEMAEHEHRQELLRTVADVFGEEGFRTAQSDPDWAFWTGSLASLFYAYAESMRQQN